MVDHGDLPQHLAHDDLDVLIVDRHTLRAVHALHAADEVLLHLAGTLHAHDLLRVERADLEGLTDRDVLAVFDQQRRALEHRVDVRLVAVVGREDDLLALLGLVDRDASVGLGDRRGTLRGARLEQLLHAGQTLRDVIRRRRTTRVEGAHRQLGAGLTDRLGRDDADGLADVHQRAGGQRTAVALRADTDRGIAGQHRAHLDALDTGRDELVDLGVADIRTRLEHDRALRIDRVDGQGAGEHRVLDVRVAHELAVGTGGRDDELQTLVRAAVLLADDDILRDVDEATREVTGVRGAEGGVGEALAGTVRGDEVLRHRQALAVRGDDRARDDLTLGVVHQATHTRDVADLQPVTTCTRGHHAVDGVRLREVRAHRLLHLVGRLGPDLDELLTTLGVGDEALLELRLRLGGLLLVLGDDLALLRRGEDVAQRDRHTRTRGPVEAGVLDAVEGRGDLHLGVLLGELVHDLRQLALVGLLAHERVALGQGVVEDRLAERGIQQPVTVVALGRFALEERQPRNPDAHLGLQVEGALVLGHDRLGDRAEDAAFAGRALDDRGQVVQTDDHVLRGQGHRAAVRRLQDVVRREHQHAGLGLRLDRQRQVHGHLVTVEVGVERRTHERVELDGLALDELRLEGLDAEAVQRGGAVQQNRALTDDLLEHVPDLGAVTLDGALGGLDVLRVTEVDQALDDERLEQLQRHLLGQTALVQLQARAHDDDRTARVVHALSEQVLAETTLLTLQHVAEGLQGAVAGAGDGAAATAVVEQRVDGLLQHPLLVVDDDLRRTEVDQATKAVVAVDHAAVQVVQIGGREAAAVELNHRAELRRDHRHDIQHHRRRVHARLQEGVDDLQALDRADLALALALGDLQVQALGLGTQVERRQAALDRLGTHVRLEVLPEAVLQLVEDLVLALERADLQRAEFLPHALELGDGVVRVLADRGHLLLGRVLDLLLLIGLGALVLERGELLLQLLQPGRDTRIPTVAEVLHLQAEVVLVRGEVAVTRLLIDRDHHVGGEVDDLLEVLRRHVEQVAQARGNALEVPDVGDRRGQFDVAHPLATHGGLGDLHAAALADDALEADALVLAARALPVAAGSEDLLAEQTVLLGLQGAVVDGLGLLDLAVGPATDVVGGGQADAKLVKSCCVEHVCLLL